MDGPSWPLLPRTFAGTLVLPQSWRSRLQGHMRFQLWRVSPGCRYSQVGFSQFTCFSAQWSGSCCNLHTCRLTAGLSYWRITYGSHCGRVLCHGMSWWETETWFVLISFRWRFSATSPLTSDSRQDLRQFLLYCSVGYGVPVCVTGISLAVISSMFAAQNNQNIWKNGWLMTNCCAHILGVPVKVSRRTWRTICMPIAAGFSILQSELYFWSVWAFCFQLWNGWENFGKAVAPVDDPGHAPHKQGNKYGSSYTCSERLNLDMTGQAN